MAISECNELIAIFVSSTKTADANGNSPQKSTIINRHSSIDIHQSKKIHRI